MKQVKLKNILIILSTMLLFNSCIDEDLNVAALNPLSTSQGATTISSSFLTQLGAVTTTTGGDNSGSERCRGVSVDSSGNVYCAGYTGGALGEANAGSNDVFVMKLNSSGDLL